MDLVIIIESRYLKNEQVKNNPTKILIIMKNRIIQGILITILTAAVFSICFIIFFNRETKHKMEPLEIKLPKPIFIGTEKNIRVSNLRKFTTDDRIPFMVPTGTTNVALKKNVTSSDETPIIGELSCITDGDKEAADGSFVELGPFKQYITIDLEAIYEIYAIAVWHFHQEPRVYYDVIVQAAEGPDFIYGAKTLFNNDIDNSTGLGVGTDMHYIETNKGELIDAKGIKGRYIRLYSNGNNINNVNHYIEVEVYGIPAK